MSANPAFPEPGPRPSPVPRKPTGKLARTIRESFAEIEDKADKLSEYFYGALFAIAPETRELFPVNMTVQRSRLLRALVHIIQRVDQPEELVPFLRQLGRDHRKFDVITHHYDAVGAALLAALKRFLGDSWTAEVEYAWNQAYGTIARTMREAAESERGPAWWPATVLACDKVTPDVAIIRVQPLGTVPFRAGDHLSVETPQRLRMWRYLSPANAPREDGSIEFHVRAVDGGWVSRAIVHHTRPGHVWRIGPPQGCLALRRPPEGDLLMLGGGTGLTPLCAIIEELVRWQSKPRTHLFFGGRTPDDLYHLDRLRALAEVHPWLEVTPVVEEGEVEGGERGTVIEAVLRRGNWSGHDIRISGSPAMIRTSVTRLLVIGTPLERIAYDPFTID